MRLGVLLGGCIVAIASSALAAENPWVVYQGGEGPGKGKHVVLVSGDEEYRSEEALPQLGKILARHHGFKCTVLFAIDNDGNINPNRNDNIPGLENLATADLMILFTRFRNLPDEQMKHVIDYTNSGKPIIGMRTATHAFNLAGNRSYAAAWTWNNKEGGYGRRVLGETWISHHGGHGSESTRGIAAPGMENHPILKGIKQGDIWGPTDVYGVRLPLPGDSKPVVLGQVVKGMKYEDPPVEGKKNDPMMPVSWVKSWQTPDGKSARVFNTTMGAATDLVAEGSRRMLVNACYWCLGMEDKIPEKSNVDVVGEFNPTRFGFNAAKKGVKPSDHDLKGN